MKLSIYTALFSSYLFNLCLHSHVMRLNHVEMLEMYFTLGPLFRKELDDLTKLCFRNRSITITASKFQNFDLLP